MFLYDTKTSHFASNDEALVKAGIIFYEGKHTDSSGKVWDVPKSRIEEIVRNTNELLTEKDLPIFTEHDKKFMSRIGDLDTPVEAVVIDKAFVRQNPKLKKLLGKTAIYSPEIAITDMDVIQKSSNKARIPISAGIDFKNNVIKEISVVGIPALNMASMFNEHDKDVVYIANPMVNFSNSRHLDLKSMVEDNEEDDEKLEEAKQLLEHLFTVFKNINESSPQQLEGNTRQELYKQTMVSFIELLEETLPTLDEATVEESVPQENKAEVQRKKKTTIISDQLQFSDDNTMDIDFSDPIVNKYADFMISNPFQKKKKKEGSLLGTVAKVGAGAVALGAGARYGGKAIKTGLASGGKKLATTLTNNAKEGTRLNNLGRSIAKQSSTLGRNTRNTVGGGDLFKNDISKVKNIFKRKKPNQPQKLLTGSMNAYDYISSFAKNVDDYVGKSLGKRSGGQRALPPGRSGGALATRKSSVYRMGRGSVRPDVPFATPKRGLGRAGKVALGLTAAGALGGAAYGINKARKTRADKGRQRGRRIAKGINRGLKAMGRKERVNYTR